MKLSKERISEQKGENIIVVISMIVIVVLAFVIFGWSSIKSWLSTPLIWKGQDSLEVYYFGTLPSNDSNEDYNIFLGISNNTNEEIDEYDITFNVEGIEFDYPSYSNSDISAYGITDATISITTSEYPSWGETRVSERTLEELLNSEGTDNVEVSCRIKSLKSHGETLVNNTGIYKDIIIVIMSLFIGIIGFFGNVKNQWLRILLKLIAIPAVIVIIAFLLLMAAVAYSNSPEGRAAAEESKRKQEAAQKAKAANEYKSASHAKAAAIARGDYKGAAYAQERMDKSAADMIVGSSSDKVAYKSAAHTKAAATARGDHKTAAYAQAEMDKKMADILKNK